MCVGCVIQLTIDRDKLNEAQRLIWESEAKVGILFACGPRPCQSTVSHKLHAVRQNTSEIAVMQLLQDGHF